MMQFQEGMTWQPFDAHGRCFCPTCGERLGEMGWQSRHWHQSRTFGLRTRLWQWRNEPTHTTLTLRAVKIGKRIGYHLSVWPKPFV